MQYICRVYVNDARNTVDGAIGKPMRLAIPVMFAERNHVDAKPVLHENPFFASFGQVPKPDGAIDGCRIEFFAISRKGKRVHAGCVTIEEDRSAGGAFSRSIERPQADAAIPACRGKPALVRGDGQFHDLALVVAEAPMAAAGEIPNDDGEIVTGRGDPFGVDEFHHVHGRLVGFQPFRGAAVPDAH